MDTTAGKWKDLGDGLGITPADAPEPPATAGPHRDSFSDSNSSVSEVDHYLDPETRGGSCVSRTLKDRFTTAGWTNRLLRKTVCLFLTYMAVPLTIHRALGSTEHMDLRDGMC